MASPPPSSVSSPLLPNPPPPPSTMTFIKSSTLLLFFLLILTLTLTSSNLSQPRVSRARARARARQTVILISCDAFRFGYQFKTHLPNLARLIATGTEAESGLVPVFPTLTFPNHYSIATGLYPPHHGIIDNHFIDPVTGRHFSMDSHNPTWWLGEPIWETVARHNLPAATYFWPGSEVKKGPWSCPPQFCHKYNKSTPFENRVDSVLGYFDLPQDQVPVLVTLYFEESDLKGHVFGPDDVEVTKAVAGVDRMIGRLIRGLESRGVFQDVNVIVVGDHGMVAICRSKYLFLDDLAPWIRIDAGWVRSYSPLFAMQPPEEVSPAEIVAKMNQGLAEVENGGRLRVFLKEDLPERLHYSDSYRIPAIIGLLDEGYKVEQNRTSSEVKDCGGDHGYDNEFFSMRSIFVGHGPRFAKGRKVKSFVNVEIYNVIASILGVKAAPNNGSDSFAESILLPGTD